MDRPLVSIIIPTYNRRDLVVQALESALNQTYRNCEVIVVDDGSTDDTETVVKKYLHASRVRYIRHGSNKGLAASRNSGLREARGHYFNLLDADDLIRNDKIERQVEFLEKNGDCSIVYSEVRFFEENEVDRLRKRPYQYYEDKIFENMIFRVFVFPHAPLFRRHVIEKIGLFDESLPCCEDSDFWIRASLAGLTFRFMNEPLAYYRIHANQMTRDKLLIWKTFIQVISRYKKHNPHLVNLAIASHKLNIAELLFRMGRAKDGRKYMLEAIRYRRDRFWTGLFITFLSLFMDGQAAFKKAGVNVPYSLFNIQPRA